MAADIYVYNTFSDYSHHNGNLIEDKDYSRWIEAICIDNSGFDRVMVIVRYDDVSVEKIDGNYSFRIAMLPVRGISTDLFMARLFLKRPDRVSLLFTEGMNYPIIRFEVENRGISRFINKYKVVSSLTVHRHINIERNKHPIPIVGNWLFDRERNRVVFILHR